MEKKESVHELSKKLNELLGHKDVSKITYKEVDVYLVPEQIIKEIRLLEKLGMGMAIDANKDRNFFYYVGKILNEEIAAYKYKLYTKHKYRTVTDEEKVRMGLEKEYILWANRERKYLELHLVDSGYTIEEARKKRDELEERIEEAKHHVESLSREYADFDVVITRYEDDLNYPTIYFTTTDGKKNNEHLRKDVANILWYEEDFERSLNRSDAKIKKITETHERLCGTIYFRRK